MWSTLPSGILFQTMSTWPSLSRRLCSCQNPKACPIHQKKRDKNKNKNKNNAAWHVTFFLSMIDVTHPFHEQLFLDTSNRWPVKSAAFHLDVQHMTNIFAKQKQMRWRKEKKRTIAILLTRLILNYNQYVVLHILGVYQNFSFRSQGSPSLLPRITIPRCFVYILWKQKQTT